MREVKAVTVPYLVIAIGQDACLPSCHIWKPFWSCLRSVGTIWVPRHTEETKEYLQLLL